MTIQSCILSAMDGHRKIASVSGASQLHQRRISKGQTNVTYVRFDGLAPTSYYW